MPRAAGDSSHYRFALVDAKGEVVDLPQYKLELPSVSHIMETALAGKTGALKGWAYNMALAGALEVAREWDPDEWADLDALKQAMKDRGFSPWQNLKQAAARGTGAHGFFEALMEGRIEFGHEDIDTPVQEVSEFRVVTDPLTETALLKPTLHWRIGRPEEHPTVPLPPEVETTWQPLDGFMRGVMSWFLHNGFYGRLKSVREQTITERPVWYLADPVPYAGTLDLLMPRTILTGSVTMKQSLCLTDLKTSQKPVKDRRLYLENRVQLTAYDRAVRYCTGLQPVAHSILVVDSEGGWREHFVDLEPRVWDAVLDMYAALKGE